MKFEEVIEIINKEIETLTDLQTRHLEQLSGFKASKVDWRELSSMQKTLSMMEYLSARINGIERIKELLEIKLRHEESKNERHDATSTNNSL